MLSVRLLTVALASSFLTVCGPRLGSIGAIMGKHNTTGQVTVREVPPDMESAKAGLRPGDEIVLINGFDARHMTAEQVHEEMVGPIGSKVALTVEREGRIFRLEVERGPLRK